MGEVGLGVKGYRLVARVVADHVTLAAVDAHVFIDESHHLLHVVEVVVRTDARQSLAQHVLREERKGRRRDRGEEEGEGKGGREEEERERGRERGGEEDRGRGGK